MGQGQQALFVCLTGRCSKPSKPGTGFFSAGRRADKAEQTDLCGAVSSSAASWCCTMHSVAAMAGQTRAEGLFVPEVDGQAAFAASPPAPVAPGTSAAPATPSAPQAPQQGYFSGALEPFVRQADVLFLPGDGAALPAHSQLLARCCSLFADILEASHGSPEQAGSNAGDPARSEAPAPTPDPALSLRGRPSPAAPLRVLVQAYSGATTELLLQAVYSPHRLQEVAVSPRGAAAYGALADLAAFCGQATLRCRAHRASFNQPFPPLSMRLNRSSLSYVLINHFICRTAFFTLPHGAALAPCSTSCACHCVAAALPWEPWWAGTSRDGWRWQSGEGRARGGHHTEEGGTTWTLRGDQCLVDSPAKRATTDCLPDACCQGPPRNEH